MTDKVLYSELTPAEFRERVAAAPVAYLPLGTLEWHGEHLPLGSDGIQSQGFFEMLARRVGGIVLPMLFVGPDREKRLPDGSFLYGMDCPRQPSHYPDQQLAGSAYRVNDQLFADLLDAILFQLRRAGFRLVVGHGHGPSTIAFRDGEARWRERHGLQTMMCWGGPGDKEGLGLQCDHAAANETSAVMALRPELVQMSRLGDDTSTLPVGVGGEEPRLHASAERGRRALELNLDHMTKRIRDALGSLP